MSPPRLAERTLELCAIRSPVGDEGAIAAHVASETGGERIGNAVVCGSAVGPRPAVILAGHLDTVPLQEGDFPPRREEGRIYGRGASDMKGALAVMVELWRNLPRADLPVELVLLFYDREEGPIAHNGLLPVVEKRADLRSAKLALCLEPTDLALQLGCCGSMHATLTFAGKSAHSARPWQGENAIHKAGALLLHLDKLQPREVRIGELTYREVMSITRIDGFTGRNVVPARCELNLNYRFAPGRSLQQAEAEIATLAQRFGAGYAITDRAPSGPAILDNPLLQELRALTAAPVEAKQAWTDVAQLALLGIPAANFGPGEQAQAHQKNESCAEEPLQRAYAMLERFLKRRCRRVIDAFIGLGSNLGDRLANLGAAVKALTDEPAFTLRKVSLAWETEPVGPPQPRYLNAVAQVGTLLSPRATLKKLQLIEEGLGRIRRERWGSREIDLDLLLYGDRVIQETGLIVPHPLLHARGFALGPLAEIAPDALHPALGAKVRDLLQALPPAERAQVRPYRPIRRPLPDVPEPPEE